MKVNRDILYEILTKISSGVDQTGIVEQFSNVIFDGKALITYNDELFFYNPFETDFTCSVDATDLLKSVKSIKEPEFRMSLRDNKLMIVSASTKAAFSVESGDKAYEIISKLSIHKITEWEELPEDFTKGLYLCQFSASTNMGKGVLVSVYVEGNCIWTSDEVRMTKYVMNGKINKDVLIPAKAIPELVKIPIRYYNFSENWGFFKTENNVIIATRLMTGEYPVLDHLFETEGELYTLPTSLKSLVEGIDFMVEGDTPLDKVIEVQIEPGKVLCTASKRENWIRKIGKFDYKGPSLKFLVNPKFLMEILDKTNEVWVGDNIATFRSAKNFAHVLSLAKL